AIVSASESISHPKVYYYMDGNNVVEQTEFLDSDGIMVYMERVIRPDGTATNKMVKNSVVDVMHFTGYNYNLFLNIYKLQGNVVSDVHKPVTRGEITGSQFYHQYITSNSCTINLSDANTVSNVLSKILAIMKCPYAIALEVATAICNTYDSRVASWTVYQNVYDVYMTYDNVYYTTCYHDTI